MCSRSPSPRGPPPRCAPGSAGSAPHGVQARTFHAAALRQLRYFAPRLLRRAGRCRSWSTARRAWSGWPRPASACAPTAPSRATWPARSSGPSRRSSSRPSTRSRRPRRGASRRSSRPRSPRSFAAYEKVKRATGVIDFEDLLRAAVWGIEEHADVAEQVRSQYRHFVVDEYQDVNPLQQRLLDAWLGDRDDLTVVGDASQTIYSFTGATSSYLLDFARQRRGATVVRLVRDYRSTPQVVGLANAVIAPGPRRAGPAAARAGRAAPVRAGAGDPVVRRRAGRGRRGGRALRRADRRRRAAPGRSPCCSGSTPSPRSTRRRSPRPGCPMWCDGAERFFERAEVRQAMVALRAATRTVPPDTPLREAVLTALEGGRVAIRRRAGRRCRPGAVGGAGRARRAGRRDARRCRWRRSARSCSGGRPPSTCRPSTG